MTPSSTNAAATLGYAQTVPCSIAHRRSVFEVFVTDSIALSPDEVLLAIQVPRAHYLWSDRRVPFHDPFAAAEGARQAAFVVIHRYLGVPIGIPFTLQRYRFQVSDLTAFRDNLRSPLEGVLRYRILDVQHRGGDLGSLSLEGELTIGPVSALRIDADVVFMSAADYTGLRAFQRARKPLADPSSDLAPQPLPPAAVGRRDERNVAVGKPSGPVDSTSCSFPLVIDRSHPAFFDHDYDHVPGPFMVEALRQAAIVVAHRSGALLSPESAFAGCEISFSGFAEFEGVVECRASSGPSPENDANAVNVAVQLNQFGAQLASGTVQLQPWPA